MKTGKPLYSFVIAVIALLLFASRSHALFTPYLSGVSNDIAAFSTTLTNPTDRAEARAVARVLKDLSKPSSSVEGDYNLFVTAALHLGRFALQPPFFEIGSNTLVYFTNVAQVEIQDTTARVAALNDFVRVKKAASNQLARAQATLDSLGSVSDPRVSILLVKLTFGRIVAANRLAAIGEEHPGFALEAADVIGQTLEHHERTGMGTVHFDNDTQVTEMDSDGTSTATYTWTRTGLNTATLTLDDGSSTTTVKVRFTSSTQGTYTLRRDEDGHVHLGSGTFTFD